jgi:hypothetical protein
MSISMTLTWVGTIAFSFCNPSRGPTSTRRTRRGRFVESIVVPFMS